MTVFCVFFAILSMCCAGGSLSSAMGAKDKSLAAMSGLFVVLSLLFTFLAFYDDDRPTPEEVCESVDYHGTYIATDEGLSLCMVYLIHREES